MNCRLLADVRVAGPTPAASVACEGSASIAAPREVNGDEGIYYADNSDADITEYVSD